MSPRTRHVRPASVRPSVRLRSLCTPLSSAGQSRHVVRPSFPHPPHPTPHHTHFPSLVSCLVVVNCKCCMPTSPFLGGWGGEGWWWFVRHLFCPLFIPSRYPLHSISLSLQKKLATSYTSPPTGGNSSYKWSKIPKTWSTSGQSSPFTRKVLAAGCLCNPLALRADSLPA